MEIDDAIEALRVALLHLDETLDGAEIVAEVQIAGRLDAGEDEFVERGHRRGSQE